MKAWILQEALKDIEYLTLDKLKHIEHLTSDKLKHIEHEYLLDESHLFANLNSLCTALGAQFIKQSARMRFDSVLTDEELVSNLTIAHSPGDKIEDLEFPFCNSEAANIVFINGKWLVRTHRNLTYNDNLLFSS